MARILALDDEEDICRLVERVLACSGHEVTAFTRAVEVMDWLRSHNPDLALLDFNLRGENGLRVLRYIRQNNPGVKVIIITGQPSQESRVKAFEMGIEDYLLKPLEIGALEHHVNKALGLI